MAMRSLAAPFVLSSTLQVLSKRSTRSVKSMASAPLSSAETSLLQEPTLITSMKKAEKVRLACPVCFQPFSYEQVEDSPIAANTSTFTCSCCGKMYSSSSRAIIDLTIPNIAMPLGASFFQNPLLAFAYDRGYRDQFWIWNFPGYDEEFRMAQKMMKPACGEVIMDLSCAGGFFTRRFVSCGEYKHVIAADYSESMLEQCRGFLESDSKLDTRNVTILRADAARLPFANSSLAAVHSGAAIHCWPQPNIAVAEIARVLRPGGVFVASTFFFPEAPSQLNGIAVPVRQAIMQLQLPFKVWTEKELQQLVESSGLVGWRCTTRGRYILFSATKAV